MGCYYMSISCVIWECKHPCKCHVTAGERLTSIVYTGNSNSHTLCECYFFQYIVYILYYNNHMCWCRKVVLLPTTWLFRGGRGDHACILAIIIALSLTNDMISNIWTQKKKTGINLLGYICVFVQMTNEIVIFYFLCTLPDLQPISIVLEILNIKGMCD